MCGAQYVSECLKRGVCDLAGLELHSAWYARNLTTHQRAAMSEAMPMESYRVYRACVELMERNGCVRCWLQRHCCICASLPPLPSALLSGHRVVLLLHHLELARASNTGKLLLRPTSSGGGDSVSRMASSGSQHFAGAQWSGADMLSSPLFAPSPSFNEDGVMLLVAGIRAHDAALQQICSDDVEGLRTFVLFPSVECVTVEQHMQRTQQAAAAAVGAVGTHKAAVEASTRVAAQTIIVVDGTYNQASQLVRRIPHHIPRVKLGQCQQTDEQYQKYVQTVRRRMGGGEEHKEDGEEDEEDEQADVHRRGKQWTGTDSRVAAAATVTVTATATDTFTTTSHLMSDSPVAPPSFLSSSFFNAVRKQPQGDRVSTIEAIAFCLYQLSLHSPQPQHSQPAPQVVFPASVLDSLLLLVDSLRLQAGLYQQYRMHSKQQRRDIKTARQSLYPLDEQHRRRSEQKQRLETVQGTGLCRPFNKQLGCNKRECKYLHRCGHCGGEHSFVRCPHMQEAFAII